MYGEFIVYAPREDEKKTLIIRFAQNLKEKLRKIRKKFVNNVNINEIYVLCKHRLYGEYT